MDSTSTFQRGALRGDVTLPGDKSISHRALIFAAAATGKSTIRGLNEGEDVRATFDALVAMGAMFTAHGDDLSAQGAVLHDPRAAIDARNSGTTARLLLGLCAGGGISAAIDGDDSLRRRPMERVAAPLRAIGALLETTAGRLPARVKGINEPRGGEFTLDVPSAQIKSAILLAHLRATGRVRISGDRGSRDHTERILRAMGRAITWDGATVEMEPGPLRGIDIQVPGDLSAAAFYCVAAAITPGSDVRIRDVGINPTRAGIIDVLRLMGAAIDIHNERESGGEPIADLRLRYQPLTAATLTGELVVRAIDEIPVLAIAAAHAIGTTRIRDAAELRLKESDRLAIMASILRDCGVAVTEHDDGLDIDGAAVAAPSRVIRTFGDHRIAMSAAVLAAASGPVSVDDAACAAVSYPAFSTDWARLQRALS